MIAMACVHDTTNILGSMAIVRTRWTSSCAGRSRRSSAASDWSSCAFSRTGFRFTWRKRHSTPSASTQKRMCGGWKRFCVVGVDFGRVLVLFRPGFGGGDSLGDRRMRVEQPLNPAGRRFFGEILLGQLIHRRNEGFDASHRLEAIAVGLALVEAGVGVERGHQQEREYGRDQDQQR